jgi:hypothetical protein
MANDDDDDLLKHLTTVVDAADSVGRADVAAIVAYLRDSFDGVEALDGATVAKVLKHPRTIATLRDLDIL